MFHVDVHVNFPNIKVDRVIGMKSETLYRDALLVFTPDAAKVRFLFWSNVGKRIKHKKQF